MFTIYFREPNNRLGQHWEDIADFQEALGVMRYYTDMGWVSWIREV